MKSVQIRSISGPYFPVFGLNTGKYRPEITPYLDTFPAVIVGKHVSVLLKNIKINCSDISARKISVKSVRLRDTFIF